MSGRGEKEEEEEGEGGKREKMGERGLEDLEIGGEAGGEGRGRERKGKKRVRRKG